MDRIMYLTMPFKMSQMNTRLLSYCSLFSKGASISFNIWGIEQIQIAQSFLHQTLCSLWPFFYIFVYVNVNKMCFKHAPTCCKAP